MRDLNEMIAKYAELKTIKLTASYFNLSPEGLRKIFIRNNIEYNKKINYNCIDNFFMQDNQDSFYWAGFIAADGSIGKNADFALSLKISDIGHIEKFKSAIASNAPIKTTGAKHMVINGINTTTSGSAIIRFRNNQWLTDLKRFNIVPNKTKTYDIPDTILNHQLFNHFLRGYFDGDGWFAKHKSTINWGICGNKPMIEKIKNILQINCNITGKPQLLKQNNIYKLTFSKQHDVSKIINYLYFGANTCLDRKREISMLAKEYDNNSPILNLDKTKLQEAYNQLKSIKLVAKEFGCCKNSIANYIKKYKI